MPYRQHHTSTKDKFGGGVIRGVFIGAAVLAASISSSAVASADTWMLAPGCPPGTYTNPDDLSGACLPGTPGNHYVAVAFSHSTGLAGWGTADSQGQADQIALAQCVANTNSVCQVIVGTHNGCVAYAVAGDGSVAQGGAGVDTASASDDALSKLPGGNVMWAQCSAP
jgi:hypothetical protein